MTHPPTEPGPGGLPQPQQPPQYAPGASYDPAQAYVVYQAVPTSGYGIPTSGQAGFDPMISPDYNGWWQRSLTIFKGAWRQLAVLQFIGFVLTLAVLIPEGIWAATAFEGIYTTSEGDVGNVDLTGLLAPFALIFVGTVLAGLVGCVITVAGNHIAVAVAAGVPPRIGPALGLAARRFLPLWGWQLLASVIIGLGVCACLLPGIYLYAVFVTLPAVVTFERNLGAIGRCFQIFHRDFGSAAARIATIAGLTLVIGIVSYVVAQIIAAAFTGTGSAASGTALTAAAVAGVVVSQVFSTLLESGMKMLTDVLTVTAYADLRARLEPLSTPVLAAEVGITPATAASQWVAPPPA
ncbi:hypothetical protein [Dactylosporangium sp. CA-233914]|uniref:hypothetical protein n=1 Tax=Dactylosporangium sp. CA-233914 TaxID=3239934 RepID=UPI003D8E1BA5